MTFRDTIDTTITKLKHFHRKTQFASAIRTTETWVRRFGNISNIAIYSLRAHYCDVFLLFTSIPACKDRHHHSHDSTRNFSTISQGQSLDVYAIENDVCFPNTELDRWKYQLDWFRLWFFSFEWLEYFLLVRISDCGEWYIVFSAQYSISI